MSTILSSIFSRPSEQQRSRGILQLCDAVSALVQTCAAAGYPTRLGIGKVEHVTAVVVLVVRTAVRRGNEV